MDQIKENKFLKGILSLVLVILFVNPVMLFLLTHNLLITVLAPTLAIVLLLFIRKYPILSRIKIYYFNLLFLCCILCSAELIFTVCYPEYNIPNLYQIRNGYYFNKPNLNQQFSDIEYSSSYITNKQGFRVDHTQDPDVEINSCDWLFLGDSYTQGAQVNFEELFSTKVYRHFPDKMILNAGISGFSIADEYNYYINEGYLLKPKRLFLQLCIFNDFMNVHPGQIGFAEYMMQYSNLYRHLFYNLQYANPRELPLGRWTEPFSDNEQQNIDCNIFYTVSSEQKKEEIANLEKYLALFKEATQKNGTELCILLIPTKEQVSVDCFTQVVDNFHIDISKIDILLPNRLMADWAQKYHFELIDLLSNFSDGQGFPFFEIDEHLNVLGHQKISDAIFNKYQSESGKYEYMSHDNEGERYPTVINNGSEILLQALINGNFQICISDTLWNRKEPLTDSPIDKFHPAMSQDGKWLVFTQGDQELGTTKVMLMNRQDGTIIPMLEQQEYGAIPAFSPCGHLIAFPLWNDVKTKPVIALYNMKTKQRSIITTSGVETWRPLFSSDGNHVYYLSRQSDGLFAIESVNLNTHLSKTVFKADYDIWDIALSPQGDSMAFSGRKNNNWDLFVLTLYNQSVKQITDTSGDEWDASFAPDGSLWFAGTFGINNGIYRMKSGWE